MISKLVLKAVLNQASKDNKDTVLALFLDNLSNNYSYNDGKVNHVLDMLLNNMTIVEEKDIDMDYIKENLDKFLYRYDSYNVKDIKIEAIDNINYAVRVSYKYIEKINEDRDDVTYQDSFVTIDIDSFPKVLKNS